MEQGLNNDIPAQEKLCELRPGHGEWCVTEDVAVEKVKYLVIIILLFPPAEPQS